MSKTRTAWSVVLDGQSPVGAGCPELHQGLAISHLGNVLTWEVAGNDYKVLDEITAAAVELRAWRRALPQDQRGLKYSDDLVTRVLDLAFAGRPRPSRSSAEARQVLICSAISLAVDSLDEPQLYLRRAEACLRVAGLALMAKVRS
jgi:hypothetical protein